MWTCANEITAHPGDPGTIVLVAVFSFLSSALRDVRDVPGLAMGKPGMLDRERAVFVT